MTFQRPERSEYMEYQAAYVDLVPQEGDLYSIFREQSERFFAFLAALSEEQGNYRYAAEKWSIKQMIGHLTDNDRIMSYRLLRVLRGDQTPLAGYEENDYVAAGDFDRYTLEELLKQYGLVRESTLALVATVQEDSWTLTGTVNGNPISVRAQVCVLIGHEQHHWNVLMERYLQ
ncbi:DinB family protein [Paenibacillus sp. sgz500958]|uniref:DinB family protein n=1 Tax=Paenibacillus sp. sgz500958 TaxID=3242475 RepID=UPI0036D37272